MKYLFLISACLMLSACTTHYNDETTIAYSGISTVRHDRPARVDSRDIQASEYSRRDDKLSDRQFRNDVSTSYHTRIEQAAPQQETQVTAPKARDPEIINQEYFSAAKRGENDIVTARLNEGANANYANAQGETVLHIAASSGNFQLASAVLNAGANVNALTSGGWTALHSAARFGHLDIVDLLLQAGVDRYAVNRDGKSALDLARLIGNSNVVSTLSQ